ncbi:MAG: plastocyanin/azurin family copper-binding protein [Parafilimonas sp.]
MKKIYLLIAAIFILKISFANTFVVTVSNYQFSPANVNAVVGDTIKWIWSSGFHTTTSTSVPAGAATWDAPMQGSGQTFLYKLTVAGSYNYFCSIHPTAMLGTLNVTGILPVTLSNFSISPAETNTAFIVWSTATEQNTDHFEIMRSPNGKTFTSIASIKAAGNSSLKQNYSYVDNTIPPASHFLYYSLTIVDKDGSKTSSDIKMYTNTNSKPKLIVSLSPNPISSPGHLMLQFNAEKQGLMHAQLFNASGKLIKEDDLSAEEGLNNGHFHIGDVGKGIYTIIFSMDGKKESYKIVVQ